MNAQEFQELMHGEIDGVNSAADSHRLQEYLRSHPEARSRYEGLCETIAALESLEMCEPPPHLRSAILAAIEGREKTSSAPTGTEGGLLFRWAAVLKTRPGYAFAAGLAVGAVLLFTVGPRLAGLHSPPEQNLYGTVLPEVRTATPAEASMIIDQPGVKAGVRAHFEADHVVVHLEVDTADPIQVVLVTAMGLTCDSFRALRTGGHDLDTRAGTTRLTCDGRGKFELTLRGPDAGTSPLTVRILRNGSLLGKKVLTAVGET